MTTGLNYDQLLEWDKYDLIDYVLSLQWEYLELQKLSANKRNELVRLYNQLEL